MLARPTRGLVWSPGGGRLSSGWVCEPRIFAARFEASDITIPSIQSEMLQLHNSLNEGTASMNESFLIYGSCVLGVFISVVLPVLRQALPKPDAKTMDESTVFQRIWKYTRPYLLTTLFSLIVGLLLVAFLRDQIADWRAGLLAGYAADSTLQKLKG
jgi:hypothetical protein